MRRSLLFLLLAFPLTVYASPDLSKVSVLVEQTAYGLTPSSCTGTVIGPYAILTATHCEVATDAVYIDGEQYTIFSRVHDKQDHSIYLIEGMGHPFKHFATIKSTPFTMGDPVYMLGNPSGEVKLYRTGHYMGKGIDPFSKDKEARLNVFDMLSYRGDSGSGIFDADGCLHDVLSFNNDLASEDPGGDGKWAMRVTEASPLAFTPSQITAAQEWVAQSLSDDKKGHSVPKTDSRPSDSQ